MSRSITLLVSIGTSLLVLVPLIAIVWMSLIVDLPRLEGPYTLRNYIVLLDPSTYTVLGRSVLYSVMTLMVTLFFALPIAWLVERTDMPLKAGIRSLLGMNILIPTFVQAMGWVFLLSPTIGLINQFLVKVLHLIPINIYTLPGMAFVQGLGFVPLAFFMLSTVFLRMDPALEEAALANKAGWSRTLLRITLPLSWPGLLATIIYIFMLGIAVLEIPLIIGVPGNIPLFSSKIFLLTRASMTVPQYGITGATSLIFLALSMFTAYFYFQTIRKSYRYAVVSGKGYRASVIELGYGKYLAWALVLLYLVLAILLPFLALVWMSLVPFIQLPSREALNTLSLEAYRHVANPIFLRSLGNTAVLVLTAPTLATALSILISWIVVRSNMRGRGLLDGVALIPLATPHILLAVSLMYLALITDRFFPVYDTVWILVISFTISFLSFGTRTLNSVMIQIHRDLEEAATTCGASPFRTMRKVIIPLIWPAVLNIWIWLFLLSFREVTMAVTLHVTGNTVISVAIWTLWANANFAAAAALSVIFIMVMGLAAGVVRLAGTSRFSGLSHSG